MRFKAMAVAVAATALTVLAGPQALAGTIAAPAGASAVTISHRLPATGTTARASQASQTRVPMAAAGTRTVLTAVSPASSITCTITAYNPTYGGFGYGQYGTSNVTCTANVQGIYLDTALYYNGQLETYSTTQTGEDTFSSANGATQWSPSIAGGWTTGAIALITWPAGYTPSSTTLGEVYSATVQLQ